MKKVVVNLAATGTLPIVGRKYAAELLCHKIERWTQDQDARALVVPATPRQSLSFSAFAAGLALGFLPDDQLAKIPFTALRRFKEEHKTLLETHQHHLLDVAERFHCLPNDPEFADRLRSLRADAAKQRATLELDASAIVLEAARSSRSFRPS